MSESGLDGWLGTGTDLESLSLQRQKNLCETLRVYKQYVRLHLEFAVTAWSPWTVADKECLERVQMRAIKMVSGLISSDYHERLAELGMETLEERRHRMDMAQVYKIVTGKDKVNSDTWLAMGREGQRMTRGNAHPLSLKQQRARLEVRRNFFSQRVVESWNKIPTVIKDTKKLQKALRSTQGQGGHRRLVPQPGLQRGQRVPQGDQRPLHGATCSRRGLHTKEQSVMSCGVGIVKVKSGTFF